MTSSHSDTIVATSSPRGGAARGVVRLSGPRAVDVARSVFSPRSGNAGRTVDDTRFGALSGDVTVWDGVSVPADLWIMRAPRTYTREDMIELHVPGAPVVLDRLVDRLERAGCRPAGPGEFTKRAFLNGRLDLSQAEGVAALIHARSEAERVSALAMLDGQTSAAVTAIAEKLLALLVPIELSIDFSDQDVDFVQDADVVAGLGEILADLERLDRRQAVAIRHSDSPRIVFVGAANAGKSSLFNVLAGEGRAIVSAVRGTTRDPLEATVRIGETTVTLVDTAGEDVTSSAVDLSAHRLRAGQIDAADFVLRLVDGRDAEASPPAPSNGWIVRTFADLLPERASTNDDVHWVSSVTGEGVDRLRVRLAQAFASGRRPSNAAGVHLTQRHRDAVARAKVAVTLAIEDVSRDAGVEIVAADLHEARSALLEVVGVDHTDDLLDRIMRDFCIGK